MRDWRRREFAVHDNFDSQFEPGDMPRHLVWRHEELRRYDQCVIKWHYRAGGYNNGFRWRTRRQLNGTLYRLRSTGLETRVPTAREVVHAGLPPAHHERHALFAFPNQPKLVDVAGSSHQQDSSQLLHCPNHDIPKKMLNSQGPLRPDPPPTPTWQDSHEGRRKPRYERLSRRRAGSNRSFHRPTSFPFAIVVPSISSTPDSGPKRP